jgi:hypothetical protein
LKHDRSIKKVSTDLDVLRFPVASERPIRLVCPKCALPLSRSQPNLNSPDRLLGVCEKCDHWFLIDLIPELTEGFLLRLPDIALIRELVVEKPSSKTSKGN